MCEAFPYTTIHIILSTTFDLLLLYLLLTNCMILNSKILELVFYCHANMFNMFICLFCLFCILSNKEYENIIALLFPLIGDHFQNLKKKNNICLKQY